MAEIFVPLAQLMQKCGYCTRFIERQSSRFLDIHCTSGLGDYEELWSEAETSYLLETSEDES